MPRRNRKGNKRNQEYISEKELKRLRKKYIVKDKKNKEK